MFLADRCSYPVFFLFPRFVHVLSFVDKDLRVCQNAKYVAALSAFRQEKLYYAEQFPYAFGTIPYHF